MSTILDNYWIVWPVGILLWLILGWAEFGYFESQAMLHPSDNRITLSYFVYYVSSKCPWAMALCMLWIGMLMGGLIIHFWAHWCPPGSVSLG